MPLPENPVIVVRSLRKLYGPTAALDGLNLTVGAGEVHGFLGPNGAGKSTTIRILLGLAKASSGTVSVLGRDPWRSQTTAKPDIAYVPGDVALWPNLTGGEIIDLIGTLRGGGDRATKQRLIADFDLDPRKKARTYSKGNRQKVALIAAFSRPAPLYVLDEPTSGLDPVMEAVFRTEVQRVREGGATVLLSSHLLNEVEQLCDRVTIVREGRSVQTSTLTQLRELSATTFRVSGIPVSGIAAIPGVGAIDEADGFVSFTATSASIPLVLAAFSGHSVTSLTAAPPTLESLFMQHYSTGAPK
ncbi:ABC transporter ATP-binding protein [soil metagenome]